MFENQLRVEDLLGRDLTVRWFEGVALIQAVCRDQLERHTADVFPMAAEILLHLDGTVTCLSSSSRGAVTTAARLLSRMLSEDVPVRLRLIVTQATGVETPYPTLVDFTNALAYFERPDGQKVLQGLAERAMTAPLRPMTAQEPDGSEPVRPLPRESSEELPPPRSNLRLVVGATVTAACVGAAFLGASALDYGRFEVALAGLGLSGVVSPSSNSSDVVAEKPPANAVGTGGGSQRRTNSARQTPQRSTERPVEKAAKGPTVQRTSSPASATRPPVAKDLGQVAAVLPLNPIIASPVASAAEFRPVFGASVEVTASVASPDEELQLDGARIFTRADAGVVPPRAIYPKLPSDPPGGEEPDTRTILELIIGTNGLVERARLRSIPRDIHEFMLVSAAKAWIFEPATIEGLPVRYRHRVKITLP